MEANIACGHVCVTGEVGQGLRNDSVISQFPVDTLVVLYSWTVRVGLETFLGVKERNTLVM